MVSEALATPEARALVSVDEHRRRLRTTGEAVKKAAISANTRRAYAADEKACQGAASELGWDWPAADEPMSADFAEGLLIHMVNQGRKLSTIKRRRAWISKRHAGMDSNPAKAPGVLEVIKGLANSADPATKKADITPSMFETAWDHLSIRQRALTVVAWMTGMRADELVSLRWSDVDDSDTGRTLHIRRSKTDQTGKGRFVAIVRSSTSSPRCPVRAIEALRVESGGDGRVFPVTTKTVANLAKRVAHLAGETPERFAAHSFRAGMITAASKAGVGIVEIMEQSGHTNPAQVVGYVRKGMAADSRCAAALAAMV